MKFTEKLLSKNSYKKATDIGKAGELFAEKILKKSGYKIIEKNFNARVGEIDIIARDGEFVAFIEVKLRKTESFGTPAEMIDKRKIEKILKASKIYIMKNNLYDTPVRFDAVLITGDLSKDERPRYEIIKNAFEG